MYHFIAERVLAPALDAARGTRTMKCLAELNESQWWPPDKIRELQNRRLIELVSYAYENIPYYRELFKARSLKPSDITSIADLPKLPLLTKNIVRENPEDIISRNYPAKLRVSMFTGGSTGEPLTFFRTRDDQQNWGYAAAERSHSWTGYRIGDKRVLISVLRPYPSAGDRIYQNGRNFFKRAIHLDAKKLSVQTLPGYVDKLQKFQPRLIHGYASALEMIANYIEGKPGLKIRPVAIICGGEQLYSRQREIIERVFACRVFRYYSSWEVHSIAAECGEHSGLHIAAENVIVEIVDDDGNPVHNGTTGRILLTNLHNFAMPFIRYEIGDKGTLGNAACACGRGLPLLTSLEGRSSDIIITRSGKRIPGAALIHIFREPMGIARFQLVQESLDLLIINMVPESEYPREHLDRVAESIANKYRALLGSDIRISTRFVDDIASTTDGKRKFIISKIPLDAV